MANIEKLTAIASQVRRDIVRMVSGAGSGHPGGSLGITDIMTSLFFEEMKQDPATWTRSAKGQDAFILSAGHLAPVYYSILSRAGYFPKEELGTLRKFGTRLQGHPSVEAGLPGIFQPSGSLGQGLSCAAGIALGKKIDGEDNFVYVLCGDGESEEGQIWEAAMFARQAELSNLIAIVDRNRLQITGNTEDAVGLDPLPEKFRAFGWNTQVIDGHNVRQIIEALNKAKAAKKKPTVIIMNTVKGKGVSFMENNVDFHGRACKPEEYKKAKAELQALIEEGSL